MNLEPQNTSSFGNLLANLRDIDFLSYWTIEINNIAELCSN